MIFDPETAASLVRSMAGAASGPSLYRRASFLLDRLGTKHRRAARHDRGRRHSSRGRSGRGRSTARGWRRGRTVLVGEGVLESYLLDTYSARKLGLDVHAPRRAATAAAWRVSTTNLMLLPGTSTPPRR